MDQLWVGLGNPGAKYAGHRHNIGFMAVDAVADDYGFGSASAKFKGAVRSGTIDGVKVLILKPGTFMNESGQSVRAAMDFFKLSIGDVTVFHDELDLDFGKVRTKIGGGMAGHNGLRSIKAHCGNETRRVRIGIDHPGHKDRVTAHVLGDFRRDEHDLRDDILNAIAREAGLLAGNKADLFATRVAEILSPAISGKG